MPLPLEPTLAEYFKGTGLDDITEDEFLQLRQRPRFYDGPLFTKERLAALRAQEA